jgi:ubiquitin carboxyl-terminal hydrolase 25/28
LREKYLGDMPLPEEPLGDQTLPVGLNNIGNTCYLNSLLQYLYTVRAVREIVTNYDAFKLDLSDDSIQKRRLGGNKMEMDRGEAVVAQACKLHVQTGASSRNI